MGRLSKSALLLLLAIAPSVPLRLYLDHRVEANLGGGRRPRPSGLPVAAPGAPAPGTPSASAVHRILERAPGHPLLAPS